MSIQVGVIDVQIGDLRIQIVPRHRPIFVFRTKSLLTMADGYHLHELVVEDRIQQWIDAGKRAILEDDSLDFFRFNFIA